MSIEKSLEISGNVGDALDRDSILTKLTDFLQDAADKGVPIDDSWLHRPTDVSDVEFAATLMRFAETNGIPSRDFLVSLGISIETIDLLTSHSASGGKELESGQLNETRTDEPALEREAVLEALFAVAEAIGMDVEDVDIDDIIGADDNDTLGNLVTLGIIHNVDPEHFLIILGISVEETDEPGRSIVIFDRTIPGTIVDLAIETE